MKNVRNFWCHLCKAAEPQKMLGEQWFWCCWKAWLLKHTKMHQWKIWKMFMFVFCVWKVAEFQSCAIVTVFCDTNDHTNQQWLWIIKRYSCDYVELRLGLTSQHHIIGLIGLVIYYSQWITCNVHVTHRK